MRQEKENASEKPRRVTIQFADDGDDSGNDYRVVDEKRAGDRHPATATQKTFAPSVTTSQHLTEDRRKRLDEESSDARAGEDAPAAAAAVTAGVEPPAASDGVSAVDDTPELHRPEYRVRYCVNAYTAVLASRRLCLEPCSVIRCCSERQHSSWFLYMLRVSSMKTAPPPPFKPPTLLIGLKVGWTSRLVIIWLAKPAN